MAEKQDITDMKVSITNKLYFGFAVAIILSLIIGISTLFMVRRQDTEANWVKHTYQVMTKIQDVRNMILDMEAGRRAFRTTNEKKFLEAYFNGNGKLKPSLMELKTMVGDNQLQIANIQKTEHDINKLLAYWGGLGTDASHYTLDDIRKIMESEEVLVDKIMADIDAMMNEEYHLLSKREQANKSALAITTWVSVIGTILVLLIIFALIRVILTEFHNRRKAEESLQRSFDDVRVLNEESNNQNWILTGVSHVNDSLQDTQDMRSLANAIIKSVIKYIDVPAGALYLYSEDKEKLVLCSSMGLPGNVEKEFKIGEGLVGRAAMSSQYTITKDVPGSFWQIQATVGTALPGQVACIPLWYNKELKGVLELATFGEFLPLHLNFLGVIANNIAVAINAADARQKVMTLLEQVQLQQIDLQNQQEELRQTNEELTRQAEVLQASEEELRVQEEELRQINAELEEKNETVEFSRQALAMKARELEVAGKYKSEFLANMSHELRTPLNSVLILAKLLSENKASNLTDKQVEYANIIHRSGKDLLNLINDILDLSKVEAGKIDLHFEDIAANTIMQDVAQPLQIIADDKNITFEKKIGDAMPATIYTDKPRLEQVIRNLLSNAFKFTDRGGKVTLSFDITKQTDILREAHLREAGEVLVISVADNGIGIPADKQLMIFEAFQQADGSTSRKYGGTGLGLSISKELVKRLAGEMRLVSEENHGSTFYIYLPLNKNHFDKVRTTPEAVTVETIQNIDFADVQKQTLIPDDRDTATKEDKLMLIIEDDVAFARLLQDYAHDKGYKTIVAVQGNEGLFYARKYKPSAIIMDIQLPVLDGMTILKMLKNDNKLRNIPVHIISAYDDAGSTRNGAIAFLKKPLEKEDLEHAFSLIAKEIESGEKKILVLGGDYLKSDLLQKMIDERRFDVQYDYVSSEAEMLDKLGTDSYDSIVVDIGNNVQRGKEQLEHIKKVAQNGKGEVPVILYLDKDLSSQEELQLKKLSDAIIHDSQQSKNRLMDELELFLYKVQESQKSVAPRVQRDINEESSLKGKKVLLADDDMRNVFALTTLLEQEQMEVVTAEDGKEAIEQLNHNADVDIILMDIMMPEMDGYEAIKRIRRSAYKDVPIIALTAKAMPGDREKAIDAGASDYIAKPIDSARLFSLMRVWLTA